MSAGSACAVIFVGRLHKQELVVSRKYCIFHFCSSSLTAVRRFRLVLRCQAHTLVSSGPTACTGLYFSYSLVEMAGIWRCSELWEINLLILTIDNQNFEAEAGILSYSRDP